MKQYGYCGSFIRKNGELYAIVEKENRLTVNSTAERKVLETKDGKHYIVINGEKFEIFVPPLVVDFEKDGVKFLVHG